jgi:hypothetical protein
MSKNSPRDLVPDRLAACETGVDPGNGEGGKKGRFVDQGRRWRAWKTPFPKLIHAASEIDPAI